MDTKKFVNNSTFYDGFEIFYEPEIELFIAENPELNIHIWDGYFSDIFDTPEFNGNEWKGFTRDYQQEVGTYEEKNVTIDIEEYLLDLMNYKNKHFRFEKTQECYKLLCDFLKYAKNNNKTVKVNWW